jgi:branched-chain amino acid transport system permease protein
MEILPQLLINSLIAGSIYALASSGLSISYGLLRILNFAHGHLMMVGVYFFYFASAQMGWSLPVSALATVLFSIILAILTLRVFILPFHKYSFILALVTTLALSTMLESVISMIFGVNVKSLSTGSSISSIEIGSIYITPIQILIIASALVLLSGIAFVIHSTPIGRKIRALSQDSHAAESLGISKKTVSTCVFIVAVFLASYAGILVGYETNMQPTMGTAYTIKAFAAMILGGLGNLWGTIVGSYILGLVENLSIGLDFGGYSIPAGYKDAFAFMIILLVLLIKPEGIFSKKRRRA